MIGILTADFSLYHDVIEVLRKRGVPFVSLVSFEQIPPTVDAVIMSCYDTFEVPDCASVTWQEGDDVETLVDRALMKCYRDASRLVIGIDPGESIGVAIFCNDQLLRRFIVTSPEETGSFVTRYVREVDIYDAVVRIGNGARLVRNRIINALATAGVAIELVDEKVLPCVDDDRIAASMIAMERGMHVSGPFSLEPKEGEIREVQRISRIKNGNITVSKELARKVLTGELTIEAAIAIQQRKNQD
jgi:hypothetical protein